MKEKTYKPGSYPDLPPPPGTVGVYGWIKNNLFSSSVNILYKNNSIILYWFKKLVK